MTEHMKFYAFEQTEPQKKRKPPAITPLDFKQIFTYNFQWKSLFFAAIGLLLAGASFAESVFPCGIGWIAAMAVWDKKRVVFQVIPVIIGSLLWTTTPLAYTAILLLLVLFFGVYTPNGNKARYLLPLTVFAATLAVRGSFLIFTGITDLLLIVIIAESILGAGLSLVFLTTLETWQRFTFMEGATWEEILCNFLLITAVIMGLEHLVIFSMPISEIAMRFAVLLGSLLGGVGGGAAVGALMGVIPSFGGATSPSALGLFAFSGLLGGVFHRFGRLGVIVGFLSGNLVLTFYLLNTSLIATSVIASMIAAGLLFIVPDKMLFRSKEVLKQGNTAVKPLLKSYHADEYVNVRLRSAGQALTSLKSALSSNKEETQEEKNIEGILNHLCRTVCHDCSLKDICWKSDFYVNYRDIMTMFAVVEAKGVLYAKDVPESFRKRCSHRKEIVASVNCLYEMYKKNVFWQQQTASGRYLAISQLENTVNLLTKIEKNLDSYVEFRKIIGSKLSVELREKNFPVDYISLNNVDDNYIDLKLKIRHCSGDGRCGRVVSNTIEELTGKKFRLREFQCGIEKNELCRCCYFLEGALNFNSHSLEMAKGGQGIVGDSHNDFILANAKHCFIISDGMGSGKKAKEEADITMNLITDVLKSGFDESFAAGMVNYLLLLNKEEEIYATADICLLDLYAKEANFVKLGAAPSFICSPNLGVKVVAGNSMPLGFGDDKPKIFKEKLIPGDILVMVSDGVLETGLDISEMELWLTETLNESAKEEAHTIAERILSGSVAFCGGKPKDDMTITVAVMG
ncbi:MAG: stage II sporulation protein E [Clostridiales bacterium]